MADFITPKQSGLAAWMVKHGKKAMINPANGNLVINKMTGITPTEKIKGMSTPTKGWFESELDMTRKVFELDTGVANQANQAYQTQGWYVISQDTTQFMSKDGKEWVKSDSISEETGYPFYLAGRIKNTWYLIALGANSTAVYMSKSKDFKIWSNYFSQINNIPVQPLYIAQTDSLMCVFSVSAAAPGVPVDQLYTAVISTFSENGEISRQLIGAEALAVVIAATDFLYTNTYTESVGIAWNGKVFCAIVLAVTFLDANQCAGHFSYTSKDGLNWQFNPAPITPIVNYVPPYDMVYMPLAYIAATNGKFCVINYSNASNSFESYTSKDGKVWAGPFTVSSNNQSRLYNANGFTASKDTFVIHGDMFSDAYVSNLQGKALYSNDGETWAESEPFGDNTAFFVGSNGDSFVAGAQWEGSQRFFYSKTGAKWEMLPLTPDIQWYNMNSYFTRR